MPPIYKPSAPDRPTNLSLNSDLLNQARALDINLSQVLEQALNAVVRQKRAEQWFQKNREAISQYNLDVEENSVFSDGLRSF